MTVYKAKSGLTLGDVILVEGKGLISGLIKKVTHGPYSHCACYVGNGYIVESNRKGVEVNPLNKYDSYEIMRHSTAKYQDLWEATQWMLNQVGAKYDFLGIVGILKSKILGIKHNTLDSKARYWCSELIADGYLNAEIPIDVHKDTPKVSPNDFTRIANFINIS